MITKKEWNRHRDNMYIALKELQQRKKIDLASYENTCQILAFTFGYSTEEFMKRLEECDDCDDVYALAENLTVEEYGMA